MLIQLNHDIKNETTRKVLVESIVSQQKELSPQELKNLSDYLLYVGDKKQTTKERSEEYPIVTKNRDATVIKRQISYEGLIDKLKNGEDGIYNIINNNKDQLLDHKDPITQEDIDNIRGLRECMDVIAMLERQYNEATTSSRRKKLKTALIDSWKQAYMIKGSNQSGRSVANNMISGLANISIPEKVYFDKDLIPHSDQPLSLLRPDSISFLLQYYQQLKQETWDMLDSDIHWHLLDLEKVVDDALEKKYPIFYDVLIWKIDGYTNKEIKEMIFDKYQEEHSEQYYSTIWTKKIPKLVAEQAQKNYLLWYFTYEEPMGHRWKTCGKCGRSLLAHSFFFSPNSSKDGYYSICKECRKKKGGKK